MNKRQEKKSETIEVRVSYTEKLAFMEACKQGGITASHAIRDYIDDFTHPQRGKKERNRLLITIAVLIVALAGTWIAVLNKSEPAPLSTAERILLSLDANGDGLLSKTDISESSVENRQTLEWLIEAADTNMDGSLSDSELAAITKITFETSLTTTDPTQPARQENVIVIPPGLSAEERQAYIEKLDIAHHVSKEDQQRLMRLIEALTQKSP